MAMSLRFEFVNLMKSDQQNLVQKVISESASNVIQYLLPLSNVLIKVHADEKLVIPEYSVGGWCYNGVEIEIAVSPNREDDWAKHLPRAIAHEWHHLARWRGPGYGSTLVDTIISEGLAQHFEIECFPGLPSFYSRFLAESQRQDAINAFLKESSDPVYDHSRWFFGSHELPFLAGYDVSFHLLEKYLNSVSSIASKEVTLQSSTLLKYLA